MQPSNVGTFIKMKCHSYDWSNWLILRGMRKGKQNKITYNIQITQVRLSKVQITSQPVQVDIFEASFKPYGLFQFWINLWHCDLYRLLVGSLGREVAITRPLKTKPREQDLNPEFQHSNSTVYTLECSGGALKTRNMFLIWSRQNNVWS